MKRKIIYFSWLLLYIACVGLGTITERSLLGNILLSLLSGAFFVPGILLLVEGIKENDKKLLLQVRLISLGIMVLTMIMIVLNIVLVNAGESAGYLLDQLLNIVSAPMYCCYIRGIPLFLWACLFVSSFPKMWKN